MTRLNANLLLLLAGAVWGMGFVAQSTAMASVGPWTFNAAKFLLAALSVLPFAVIEARRAPRSLPRAEWRGFAGIGAMLFAGSILQQIGITGTSVTNSGFLTGLYVVFTPILGLLILGQRPHWIVWPCALAAFVGIVLVGGGSIGALNAGDTLVILCAAFFALQILFVGRFALSSGRPMTLSFIQFAVTAGLSGVGVLTLETPSLQGLGGAWMEIVYGGVFSTGLAFTLQVIAQRYTTPPQAAIFLSSEALFAALFAAFLLGERIALIGVLGCGLIFAAMLAVEIVPARRRTP